MAQGHAHLPEQQETWLQSAGVNLQYLNLKNGVNINNFGLASLLKFKILQMLEYDRVMFLDSDVIPLCHMEAMFLESFRPNGMLQDNVVIAGPSAPATASLFLLKPQQGEFESIVRVVHRYRDTHNGSLIMDRDYGWGHKMSAKQDRWEPWKKSGTNDYQHHQQWNFYGANADQGLLLYWVRYMKMNYSQILTDRVQTWAEVTNHPNFNNNNNSQAIPVEGRLLAQIQQVHSNQLPSCTNGAASFRQDKMLQNAPYSDHIHFMANTKPWFTAIHANDIPPTLPPKLVSLEAQRNFWLYHLGRANETFQLGLPSTMEAAKQNPFGKASKDNDLLDPKAELP